MDFNDYVIQKYFIEILCEINVPQTKVINLVKVTTADGDVLRVNQTRRLRPV